MAVCDKAKTMCCLPRRQSWPRALKAFATDDIVEFVKSGVDVDVQRDGWTPLMWAMAMFAPKVAVYIATRRMADLRIVAAYATQPLTLPYGESVYTDGMTAADMCTAMVESCTRACKQVPSYVEVFCSLTGVSIPKPPPMLHDECPVCMEPIYEMCPHMTCKHALCMSCATQLHRPHCPMCDKALDAVPLAVVFYELRGAVVELRVALHGVTKHDAFQRAADMLRRKWNRFADKGLCVQSGTLFQTGIRHRSTVNLH